MKRALIAVGAGVAVLGLLSIDDPAPAPPGSPPPYAEVRALLHDAHALTGASVRVPAEWAAPRLAQAGLTSWLATLPMDGDVRARLVARVGAGSFVDELVPFALFARTMYEPPDVAPFSPPAAASPASPPALPPDQTARLLALYDAVYLRDVPADARESDRLACDAGDDVLAARAARAAPVVRDLLAAHAEGLPPGDMKDAVGHALRDPDTLDALALTLVEFVDGEVCKHYRMFAAQVAGERALADRLTDALLDPTRDDGWRWLRWHASRHLAVHVVVDGLQGHLVAALARGEPGDPFLAQALADLDVARPTLASTKAAPPTTDAALREAVAHGAAARLPNLARAVASPGFVAHGISTTPTISVRNLPIAKTGAPVAGPGGTGIPNFHFVDRAYTRDGVQQGRPWYFYGNDALQLAKLTKAAGMRTMFERLDGLVTMSCGAQYDEAAGYGFDGFLALALGEKFRDFGETRCVAELRKRAANERRVAEIRDALLAREPLLRARHHPWELWDRWAQREEADTVRRLVDELAALEPVAMPDYLLWYDPWPDHFAHAVGPLSDAIIGEGGELQRLDHWIGEVGAAYDAAGVGDRTLFGMAGDHGLTTVRWIVSPEAEVIGGLAKDGVPLKLAKISSDEGEGPKLTHRLRPPSMRGYDVVVASTAGGNYMMDFFVEPDWARQPVLAELRVLRTLGGKRVDIVAEILRRLGDTLDYLAVRESACGPDACATAVMNARGTGHLDRRGDRIAYRFEGEDPLGLDVVSPYERFGADVLAAAADLRSACLAEGCDEATWRAATRVNRRPDAVTQLAHLYDTDRAGTVNLFPRDGVGYNTKVPGRHAGESFHEKDAFVGTWGTPAHAAPDTAVNGAVAETLYTWVTGDATKRGEDGWGYDPL